jgi:hypothetical protein
MPTLAAEGSGPVTPDLGADLHHAFAPIEAGIDTWRLAYYLESDRDLRRIREATTRPGPGCWIAPAKLLGHTVGFVPSADMLFLEGHPSAMGLGSPNQLAETERELLHAVGESIGVNAPRPAGVSRLDATVTTSFADPRHGRAVLSGIAALDHPRCKPEVIGKPPETVYLLASHGRGRKLARAYDKGLETHSAPAGQLIRLEDQRRWPKASRRDVTELTTPYVRQKFQARFAGLWQASKGVTVASIPVLSREIAERFDRGDLTYREAERLAGYLVLDAGGIKGGSRWTAQRRRRELRDHGLVLADDYFEAVSVDLAPILEAALETDAWERAC